MKNDRRGATPTKGHWRDFVPVIAVLVISLSTTYAVWHNEVQRVADDGQLRFEQASQIIQDDIITTMQAYGQILRGGVGLLHASQNVTRGEWAQYVDDLALAETYPGIQGIGFNAVVRGPAGLTSFEAGIKATDRSDFAIRPAGDRPLYVPVLYLEPLDWRNERAIGFDIYSEPLRRAAIERAIETGEPSLTAKITLVQENTETGADDVQSGVLLIMPVFGEAGLPATSTDRHAQVTGVIVSVFRMGDLVGSLLAKRDDRLGTEINVDLYDADHPSAERALFLGNAGSDETTTEAKFTKATTFRLYGRDWTLNTSSKPAFHAQVASNNPAVIATAGLLLSLLLTALAWGQSVRTREAAATAALMADNQRHIQLLMGEVNHRSKNLLAVVQAIARQTVSSNPEQFLGQFSERVDALAASQDLLVRNKWKGILLSDLVTSQLAPFTDVVGTRVLAHGPVFKLHAAAAQTIGMALHELATNAGKHGALSNDTGTVDIQWYVTTDTDGCERLFLSWIEAGGPAVTKPTRQGFGSIVLGAMTKSRLNAKVETTYAPSGFAWHVNCPADAAQETTATA